MSNHIASHWHRVLDAVKESKIGIITSNDIAEPISKRSDVDHDRLREILDVMSAAPRFVMDDKAIKVVLTNGATKTINDMHLCGVLRLPYPVLVIEYNSVDTIYSVFIQEEANEDGTYSWLAHIIGSYRDDDGDTFVLAFPAMIRMHVTSSESTEAEGREATFGLTGVKSPYMMNSETVGELIPAIEKSLANKCIVGFLAAVVGLNTIGMKNEVVREPTALNKARAHKGKSAVPAYTLIRIGSFSDASGRSHQVSDGSPTREVFLRRGHRRRVAVGQGRTGRRWRYFPPQVVGYLPDGRKPTMVEVIATRAARPYQVKAPAEVD